MFPKVVFTATVLAASTLACLGQAKSPIEPKGAARPVNLEATYAALRQSLPVGEGLAVHGLTIKREGGVFRFDDGVFTLYSQVQGRVTGAVFAGKGTFALAPKSASEQKSLALLTKGSAALEEPFTSVALRFTDGTADEIRKAATAAPAASGALGQGRDLASNLRNKLHENVEVRLLADVLAGRAGETQGFFLASLRTAGFFSGKNLLFVVDPEGTMNAAPDQVELSTWASDTPPQVFAAYRLETPVAGTGAVPMHIGSEELDLTLERSGKLHARADVDLSLRAGVRVLRFHLFPTLRVEGVYDASGAPLDFIQEGKDADPEFAVELPSTAAAGGPTRLHIRYSGPDAIEREGDDIYDIVHQARESWYPSGREVFGGFANYRMTFHLPKGLDVVATGNHVSTDKEANGQRIVWETKTPIPVAGFNLGNFHHAEAKTPQGFTVTAYADETLPDWIASHVEELHVGTMTTLAGLPDQVAQGNAAIQVYTDYFGPLPYDHVSITQQNYCLDGQGWPTMVYLPICAFWDATIRERLGLMDFGADAFWREVTPHEVSHQWWGNLVGWSSYRDQWMSEGFATFSAGLYLLETNKDRKPYLDYWQEQHKYLLDKNRMGIRPIDVGPVTMGYRVSNDKNGDVYQALVYSKGAYILHMLEMMYWTSEQKEAPFKHTMQTFAHDFAGKPATTEDFKASVEKTMPKWLDLDGNGKLDWFFDEYVYGTEIPHYEVTSEFTTDANGATLVHFKATQSKVSKDFRMLVPLYLELTNGAHLRLGSLNFRGDATVDHSIKLGKLPSPAKRLAFNLNADVLSD